MPIPPTGTRSLTQVLAAIGDDRLREAGPKRAALFTWERTTRELHTLLSPA